MIGSGQRNNFANLSTFRIRHWIPGKPEMQTRRTSPLPLGRFRNLARGKCCRPDDHRGLCRLAGSVRDFLQYEPKRVDLPPNQIVRVLKICKMISSKRRKQPRYRGSTQKVQPGTILVTDGKGLSVHLTTGGKTKDYNWQGMVDQTTACHTAVVVTETENAHGVLTAYEQSVDFLDANPTRWFTTTSRFTKIVFLGKPLSRTRR